MTTTSRTDRFDPAGKVVVITGASSGIGEATAKRLAGLGMTVIAVARRGERLKALSDGNDRIHDYVADVTDTDAIDALAEWVRREHGACHVLINNAGVSGGPLRSREDLEGQLQTIDINLGGTVRCIAAFADLLADSAPARVINVASVAGKVGVGPAAYAASKFGMVGLSESLALSWRRRGVTVCQLNPGFIETEGFPQDHLKGGPMRRLIGKPQDVAVAIEDAIRTGVSERTVPRWYRGIVVLRHVAAPVFRAAAGGMGGSRGSRT